MPYSKNLALKKSQLQRLKDNLCNLRAESGYSIIELAEKLGVTPNYLYAIEGDMSTVPNVPFMVKLAKVFGKGSFTRMFKGVTS
jgi:transcriptional regulator with XRE-family HTH domain